MHRQAIAQDWQARSHRDHHYLTVEDLYWVSFWAISIVKHLGSGYLLASESTSPFLPITDCAAGYLPPS